MIGDGVVKNGFFETGFAVEFGHVEYLGIRIGVNNERIKVSTAGSHKSKVIMNEEYN